MDLVGRMEELLQAERAGVKCLDLMANETSGPERKALFLRFRSDEGRYCAGLHRLISARGVVPTSLVGAFAEKVRALPTEVERMALLIKGQAWVVRKIAEIPSEEMKGDEQAFFQEMRETHDRNIAACRKLLS
jgi:hypothetical protein